jgi:hypothetical protein
LQQDATEALARKMPEDRREFNRRRSKNARRIAIAA